MSLTKDDLRAIKGVVEETVQPMIDDLAQNTAAGFAEVHEKIDGIASELHEVSSKVDVKDGKLENTLERIDGHGLRIGKMEQKLKIA